MTRLPLGLIILLIVSVLVYFGLAHRVLDRMRLSDKGALIALGALIVGSFIDIPISNGNIRTSVNVGGALVPLGLAIYLLVKAGTTKEWGRALAGSVVTGAIVYGIGSLLMTGDPSETGRFNLIDPLYVYPIVGGLVAYLLGRSRRAAFIAATLGVLLTDIGHLTWLIFTGRSGTVDIGGAGAFDSIVIAGIIAVLLAEVIGESRERLQGGPASESRDPDLLAHLKSIDSQKVEAHDVNHEETHHEQTNHEEKHEEDHHEETNMEMRGEDKQ